MGYGQWGIGRVLSFEGTVWRVGDESGDGCGGGGNGDWHYMQSYDPYAPAPDEDAVTASCGGGGAGFDTGNYSCHWDHITLEISYDGGQTWQHFWSGWAQICDEQMT